MPVDELFQRILAGLTDDHDIRVLSNMMLTKLLVLDPESTQRHLDPIAEKFRVTLTFKAGEKTIKQEIEKASEASNAVLRTSLQLDRAFPQARSKSSEHPGWNAYWEWVRKEFGGRLKEVDDERVVLVLMKGGRS